jgi:hypothetical protein
VLRAGSNLLVHLAPAPVVARVPRTTAAVRPGDAWLRREVLVAGHLARAGAPVVPPVDEVPPGPHLRDGVHVTLWRLVPPGPPLDPRAAGAGLARCHAELADLDADGWEPLGVLHEARRILAGIPDRLLAPRDRAFLVGAADRSLAEVDALGLPWRVLHGDAYLRNVLAGPAGPLWSDWEDTFLGPPEWDLACLHAAARLFGDDPRAVAEAQRGYGPEPPPEVLEPLITARAVQGAAWLALSLSLRGEDDGRLARTVEELRALVPD